MNFVTGGTGLLGSYLLLELTKRNESVRALRRDTSSMDVIKNVFKTYFEEDWEKYFEKIEWVNGDILDIVSLQGAMNEVDYIFHSAGYVSFQPEDKKKLFQINQQGTANVVNAALKKNVKKLIYVSSTAALDKPDNDNVHKEDQTWSNSKSATHYGKSKYLGELEAWRGYEEGLDVVIVNPSIILGYGDYSKGSTKLFTKVYNGLKFYTGGTGGFVDVKDVVEVMLQLMNSDIHGRRFIVNAEDVRFKQIFELIAKAFDKPAPKWRANPFMAGIYWRLEWLKSKLTGQQAIVTRETSKAGQRHSYYSNQKIKETLGYQFIPIQDTIHEIASILKKELD